MARKLAAHLPNERPWVGKAESFGGAQALAYYFQRAINKYGLSARAYDCILKVSCTIADLLGAEQVADEHLAEAVQYRTLDRNFWQ